MKIIPGLKDGEMAVGGYIAPTPKMKDGDFDTLTDRVYRDMRDCGINFLDSPSFSLDGKREAFEKQMELAEKYGINVLVADEVAASGECDAAKLVESAARYSKYKAYIGIHGKDEPSAAQFETVAKNKKAFDKAFPDKDFFVNFFPDYAAKELLTDGDYTGGDAYEYYIDRALSVIPLSYLSFDFYPFVGQGDSFLGGYYKTMEVIADRAKKHGLPFLSCIQATSWCESYARYVNYAEMSFLVKSALAFGAKGVIYFTYAVPVGELSPEESFSQALIDLKGDRTERYYYAKANNAHIRNVAPILTKSVNQGMIRAGRSIDEIPARCLISGYKGLKKATADHALIGCFDCGGDAVFYALNNDVKQSDKISLLFDGEYDFDVYVDDSKFSGRGGSVAMNIQAGNAFMVHLRGKGE